MAQNVLIIDSDYNEANPFVEGLRRSTSENWTIDLHVNNKIYGIRRYLKFFTVAFSVFIKRKQYRGKTILCWQQFYGIALACLFRLFHVKHEFNLVIMTFIYRERTGFLGKLFYNFVHFAISSEYADAIICTSSSEVNMYSKLFNISTEKFKFVKWGVVDWNEKINENPILKNKNYFFSTGRSNRDYQFLIDSFMGSQYKLIIACDTLSEMKNTNVEIRNDLFDEEMLTYMKNSVAVVIALQDETIAAGQLVLLHAMNLGVPVIVTASKGITDDYVINEYNGLVIEKDKDSLLKALDRIISDSNLYRTLSENGKKEFHSQYTKELLGENIGRIVRSVNEKKVAPD